MLRIDRLDIKNSVRLGVIALVAIVLMPIFAITSGANAASTHDQLLKDIQFSENSHRTNPHVLNNSIVGGNIFVFIDQSLNSRIARVDFYIDQIYGGKITGIDRTDYKAPFDLVGPGGSDTSQANPWNTKKLAQGQHIILATITWNDKSQELAGAKFYVGSPTGGTPSTTSPATTTPTTSPGTTTPTTTPPTTTPTTVPINKDVFGMSMGATLWSTPSDQMDNQVGGVAALGAKWMRTAFYWRSIEPNGPNQDNWSKADALVAAAQKNKVSLVMQFNGMPDWASGGSTGAFPKDPKLFATFAAKVAARYKGRVAAYELGNEPNHLKTFSSPDTQLYVDVLKVAYPAIKAADPNVTVLTAGVGGTTTKDGQVAGDTFVKELYADGGKNYFDGIAYHPYTYPETPSQSLKTGDRGWVRMLNARATMVANGDANKKIWVTEFGAPTNGSNGITPDQQAAMLQDAYQLWQTYSWAGPMFWFTYQDKTSTDNVSHKGWFGLLNAGGGRKPSAATFQKLAAQSDARRN